MAFLQDTRREPMFKVPAVVLALIALIVAAHLARVWLLSAPAADAVAAQYGFVPLRYAPGAGSLFERIVPLFSHIFVHVDAMHLTINCLWLLAFGPGVARRYGPAAFLLFFFVCGVASAATHLAFHWGDERVVVGASGAISGLMAAGIRILRPPPLPPSTALMPILSAQVMAFSAFWVAINLVAGFLGLEFLGDQYQSAWQGHLGGYFAGLLLCAPFDRLVGLESERAVPN